jgi:hypothetical protein
MTNSTNCSHRNGVALFGMLLLGATLLACGADEVEQLRARSSFDLQCPKDQLRMVRIDDRTVGVTGCGTRAVYVESCSFDDCTWILNSDGKRAKD